MSWLPELIDEVMFRRLLLEELRTLNSNIARMTHSVEMVFPPPPESSYTMNPEDTAIEFANEGPSEADNESEGPARLRQGNVEAEGSDAF